MVLAENPISEIREVGFCAFYAMTVRPGLWDL